MSSPLFVSSPTATYALYNKKLQTYVNYTDEEGYHYATIGNADHTTNLASKREELKYLQQSWFAKRGGVNREDVADFCIIKLLINPVGIME